ncbi:MAG: hypothetical protein LH606_04565 [Cytophagaceae bacterium]|nr:hypothetical protein [Cytophagaceae bacterium]
MEAISEIKTVENGQVTVKIPETFRAKKVRVIVLAEEEALENPQKLSELRGSLPDLNLIEWDEHLGKMRDEWER